MQIKITNVRLPVEAHEPNLEHDLIGRLGLAEGELLRWKILRKSLDARQRRSLQFVYTLLAEVPADYSPAQDPDLHAYQPTPFIEAEPGSEEMNERPVIVGSGPAGLLAGYYLALHGYRPIIIERGHPVKERVPAIRRFDNGEPFEQENNYLFGEGGAGCFSDGKLTCRMTGPDVDWVLERFVQCGGRESLIYEHRPHLGSNKLPMICRNFRRKIEELGGEYRFHCRLEGLQIEGGKLIAAHTSSGTIQTSQLVLAIGHSARDTYQMLHELGVPIQQKAFQLGLRIEQPQEQVNRHKYGNDRYFEILGAADYTVVAKGERDLYTFCMCAGGVIIPSVSEPNRICSNGMSDSRHNTPFANSGLVVTLEPAEFGSAHPLAGVHVQQQYERIAYQLAGGDYQLPIQTAADYLAERTPDPSAHYHCSYQRGTRPADLHSVLPTAIHKAIQQGLPVMDRKWRGDFLKNAILVGPEMRGSSPVRIERNMQNRECPNIAGLYPIGEGAGYAGGIISAAVDGLRTAKVIVSRFAPLERVIV